MEGVTRYSSPDRAEAAGSSYQCNDNYGTPRSSRCRSSPYHISSRTGLKHKLTYVSPKLWRSTGRTLTTGTGTPVPVATELKLDTLVQTIITNMKSEIQVLCLIINSVFICFFLVTNGIFERGTQTLNVGRDQCK